jgi:hypothetical protein
MSGWSCHVCHSRKTRLLYMVSLYCQVDYYRCDGCGHVWTIPKSGDTNARRDVTKRELDERSTRAPEADPDTST